MSKLLVTNKWRLIAGVICLLVGSVVGMPHASAQSDAYSIVVAVTDRSADEKQDAYQVGMRSVLLTNSGDKTLLNRDDVRAGLQSADTYVESFKYEAPAPGTIISPTTPLTDSVRDTGEATQLMTIQFNRELIEQLIRPGTSAVTPDETADDEPFTNVSSALMWLIIEDGGNQILVGGAATQNVVERAREIAGGVGISLSFPAADDEDEQAVSTDDIKTALTANTAASVAAASARYAQPLTLAAHLSRTRAGSWDGSWLKMAGDQLESQSMTAASLDQAIQQGIAWLGPQALQDTQVQPSAQLSPRANVSSTEGLVWVGPLPNTQSYAQVMQFINSLDSVTAVYPKEVIGSGMVFAIVPLSAVSAVTNASTAFDWIRSTATPTSAKESRFADGISASFEFLR